MFNNLVSAQVDALRILREFAKTDFCPTIEVGLGQKSFLGYFLKEGYLNLTALDVSEAVIESTKRKYPQYDALIRWLCSDVFTAPLKQNYYALWHDGALFQKLVSDEQRENYINILESSLRPGGYAVIFASSVLEESLNKLRDTSLELVKSNWNPLYPLYLGSMEGDAEGLPDGKLVNKKLHVIKRKA